MALEIKKSGRKWGQPLNDLTLTATMAWLSKDSTILCSRWGHSVPVFVAKSYLKPPNTFACWSLVFVTQTHISATSTVHNYQFLILKATFVLVLLSIIWHFGKKTKKFRARSPFGFVWKCAYNTPNPLVNRIRSSHDVPRCPTMSGLSQDNSSSRKRPRIASKGSAGGGFFGSVVAMKHWHHWQSNWMFDGILKGFMGFGVILMGL
jgi:hypothetical protein